MSTENFRITRRKSHYCRTMVAKSPVIRYDSREQIICGRIKQRISVNGETAVAFGNTGAKQTSLCGCRKGFMTRRKHRILAAAALLAWLGFIFFMSALNAEESAKLSDFIASLWPFHKPGEEGEDGVLTLLIRKGAHAFEFAVLSALTFRVLQLFTKHGTKRMLPEAFIFTVLYAASDEFHQTFVAGRCGTPKDVLIDSAGAILALCIIGCVSVLRKRKNARLLQDS